MPALTVQEVKERIAALDSMSALKREDFCEENGLADSLAQRFGKEELKAVQLRKVFQELKAIQREVERGIKTEEDRQRSFDRTRVVGLMPILAYTSGRGLIPKDFYEILRDCLSAQKLKTNEFVEAILAYHKFRHP